MRIHPIIHNTIDWTLRTDIGQRALLVAGAIIISFAWINIAGYNLICNIDCGSYLSAGDVFFSGHIDHFRTPVYPIICHLATSILQYDGLYIVATLQFLAFLVSIIYIHKAAATFIGSYKFRFFATALYAWSIPVIDTTTVILTESFTISGIAIFIYLLLRIATHTASRRHSVATPLLLATLILLRPFNICFIPVLIIAIATARKNPNVYKSAIVSSLISIGIILAYCTLFYIEHGKFQLSSVTSVNHAFIFDTTNDYLTVKTLPLADTDSIHNIEYWQITYPNEHLDEADSIYRHDIWHFATSRITQFDASTDSFFPQYFNRRCYTYFYQIQCVTLAQVYFLLLIICLHTIYVHIRYRRNNMPLAILLLTCFITIFTAVWGGDNSGFGRLMMPMFPALCLLLAGFIDSIGLRLITTTAQKN